MPTFKRDFKEAASDRGNAQTRLGIHPQGYYGVILGLVIGIAGTMSYPFVLEQIPKENRDKIIQIPDNINKPNFVYTFYEKLNKEEPTEFIQSPSPIKEKMPATYYIQAGSYSKRADAEKVKAELAFQGIESKIKAATLDLGNVYRVIIGPNTQHQSTEITKKLNKFGIETIFVN